MIIEGICNWGIVNAASSFQPSAFSKGKGANAESKAKALPFDFAQVTREFQISALVKLGRGTLATKQFQVSSFKTAKAFGLATGWWHRSANRERKN